MVKYTLDRFEGDFAVLLLREDESIQTDVPRHQLPDEVKEGDILDVEFGKQNEVVNVSILKDETKAARERTKALLQKILDKNK